MGFRLALAPFRSFSNGSSLAIAFSFRVGLEAVDLGQLKCPQVRVSLSGVVPGLIGSLSSGTWWKSDAVSRGGFYILCLRRRPMLLSCQTRISGPMETVFLPTQSNH